MADKLYLGDAVYGEFDSEHLALVLTTEDGERETNRIVLETEVLGVLMGWMARERRAFQARKAAAKEGGS